jgi:hypothetical protein
MKKDNYENIGKEKRNLKVATYIRVGNKEQLSLQAEQGHSNLEMECFRREEHNEAISYEKGISYIGSTRI